MQYRAVICDIDDTLVPVGRTAVSARTRLTLLALKSAGVRIVLATGRAPQVALAVAEKIPYDALVCAQGAALVLPGERPRALHTLTEQQMYALVDFCEDGEWPLNFVFNEGYFAYVEYERMQRETPQNDNQRPWLFDGQDQNKHLEGMPYGACAFLPAQAVQAFQARYGHLELCFVPFAPGKWDIFSKRVNKAVAVQQVLEKWGISWQQAAAIGDGAGDVCLLEKAGLSAAMENGCPQAKAAAGHIAPPAQDDGAAQFFSRYLLQTLREEPPRTPEGGMPHGI